MKVSGLFVMHLHPRWRSWYVDVRPALSAPSLCGCVPIFVRQLVILKPVRLKPAVCVYVTGRLVATGGGKQADLYSFDQPGGRGCAGGVSKTVGSRREMEGKMGVYSSIRNVCCRVRQYVFSQICVCICASPRPAVRFPVCRRCWCRGARLSRFAWTLTACQLGTRRSSAESGLAPGWSRYRPQSPAASPHMMDFPICRDREKVEGGGVVFKAIAIFYKLTQDT